MSVNEHILNNFGDIVYSCLIPHDLHWEHRMPAHGVIYVRSGNLVIEDKGQKTVVPAGGYVFVRRDCNVNVTKVPDGETPYTGINIRLPRKALREYYSMIPQGKLPRQVKALEEVAYRLPQTPALDGLFQSLIPYVDANTSPTEEMLELKIREAIVCLLSTDRRFYPTLFDFNESWKIDLLEFMEQNFTEDLSLEEFASYTGRSLATFKRDFAKISDIPPQKWINEHRLQLAHSLLKEGSLSTSDVAWRVGFRNRSYFSTAFKQYFGYAPGAVAHM